jgi:hypothetical protein
MPAGVMDELKLQLEFQLIRDTSRQLLGWILPDAVNTIALLLMGEHIARNM